MHLIYRMECTVTEQRVNGRTTLGKININIFCFCKLKVSNKVFELNSEGRGGISQKGDGFFPLPFSKFYRDLISVCESSFLT